jgi:23S rRNA pseudouridine1911/1915/1917 synthase
MTPFSDLLDILYEDNHLMGLNKPAGWPTTHFDGTEETVDRLVKAYLKEKYQKPGNVFLGVVHRLDKLTSGALIFARTSKAASRLSEQFRDGAAEKVYWAVVEPTVVDGRKPRELPDAGTLIDHLFHDEVEKRVRAVTADFPGAKPARLHYAVKAKADGKLLLEIRPQTGRKHQLRVQLASRGYPILGDSKYGSAESYGAFIALHARQLTVIHPTLNEPITLTAEVPKNWKGRFARLIS